MTTPHRRQSDKWTKSDWIKLSILALVLSAVVGLMTNIFGNRIKPEVNSRLTGLETSVSVHAIEAAEIKTNQVNLKELILRIEKKVDRLLWRKNNGGTRRGGNTKE